MFRRPMRLERWIAFDGVGLVDSISDVDDVGDDHAAATDEQTSENVFSVAESGNSPYEESDSLDPFSPVMDVFADVVPFWQSVNTLLLDFPDFPQHNGEVSLTFPVGYDRPDHFDASGLTSYLPFIYDNDITFSISASAAADIAVEKLFLGVGFPENGAFSLFDVYGGQSLSSFIQANHIEVGTRLAVSYGSIPDSGIYTGTVRVGTVTEVFPGYYTLADSEHVARSYIVDNSLRFGFTADAVAEDVAVLLSSLVYTPNGSQSESGDSFPVSLFHDLTGTAYSPYKLIGGANCAFVEGKSAGEIQDATKPCDTSGAVLDGGSGDGGDGDPEIPPLPPDPDPDPDPTTPDPDPDPRPDTPPEEDIDPYVPPTDGRQDNSSDDVGDTTGDAGGDAANEFDNWFSFVVDKEGEEEYQDEQPSAAEPKIAATTETLGETDDDDAEQTDSPLEDVLREARQALEGALTVQRRLETALSLLHAEYAARSGAWTPGAKEFLRELFASGGDQRQAISQVANLLAQETDGLLRTSPERRDGMLSEAIRELSDSAAKQSGTTTVLISALERVVDAMRVSRDGGGEAPEGGTLRDEFEQAHRLALREWNEKAALRDPMGRELEYFQRLQAAAK